MLSKEQLKKVPIIKRTFTNVDEFSGVPADPELLIEVSFLVKCEECGAEQMASLSDPEGSPDGLEFKGNYECINCQTTDFDLQLIFASFSDDEFAFRESSSSLFEIIDSIPYIQDLELLESNLLLNREIELELIEEQLNDVDLSCNTLDDGKALIKKLGNKALNIFFSEEISILVRASLRSEPPPSQVTPKYRRYFLTRGRSIQQDVYGGVTGANHKKLLEFILLLHNLIKLQDQPSLEIFRSVQKGIRLFKLFKKDIEDLLSIGSILEYFVSLRDKFPNFQFQFNELLHEIFIIIEGFHKKRGRPNVIFSIKESPAESKKIFNSLMKKIDTNLVGWEPVHCSFVKTQTFGIPVYLSLFNDESGYFKLYLKIPPPKKMDNPEIYEKIRTLMSSIRRKFGFKKTDSDVLKRISDFFEGMLTPEPEAVECNENRGDMQLESSTSLLISTLQESEQVILVDYGCGYGRLLGTLDTFPDDLLGRLEYYGVDIDDTRLFTTDLEGIRLSLNERLRSFETLTVSELKERNDLNDQVDFIFVLNTLHEINIQEIPDLFTLFNTKIKPNGQVTIQETTLLKYFEKNVFSYRKQDFEFLFHLLYRPDQVIIRAHPTSSEFPLIYATISGKGLEITRDEFINHLRDMLRRKKESNLQIYNQLLEKSELNKVDISEIMNLLANSIHIENSLKELNELEKSH